VTGSGPSVSIIDGEFLDYLGVLLAFRGGLCSVELIT
jgi:hypothetical protein